MDLAVDLPEADVLVAGGLGEERPLKRHIVAADHGEAIERQNIADISKSIIKGIGMRSFLLIIWRVLNEFSVIE